MSTLIAIPLVIVKHLFPAKESDQIVEVITKFIDYDKAIREQEIKSKNSSKNSTIYNKTDD